MRVLVATRTSQGMRERDLDDGCFGGEMVRPIEERCPREGRDEPLCECETAFVALASGRLTTTATVQERPGLTMADYAALLRTSLSETEAAFVIAERYAEELVRVAAAYEPGAVLERWDEFIRLRFDVLTGELLEDVTALADVDPDELEDALLEIETDDLEAG